MPLTFTSAGRPLQRLRGPPLKIAVVACNIGRLDGVSNGVRDTIRAVSSVPQWRVSVFSWRNECPEIPVNTVTNAHSLINHPDFKMADAIIYHYGIHHDLFEALRTGNGHAAQFVFFHNITPAKYVSRELHNLIDRSFDQLPVLRHADWLWPISETNAQVLRDGGFDSNQIEIIPPSIEWPPWFRLEDKAPAPIRILYVGRITQSKGILDLLGALAIVLSGQTIQFRAGIVGSVHARDREYLAAIEAAIDQLGVGQSVELVGPIDAENLAGRYHAAHILVTASYHEGFCRPVAEGLRAGCVPVGYASYNAPLVANGLGRFVPPGNVRELAGAILDVAAALQRAAVDQSVTLPLDGGPMTIMKFDRAARKQAGQFSFEKLACKMIARIRKFT